MNPLIHRFVAEGLLRDPEFGTKLEWAEHPGALQSGRSRLYEILSGAIDLVPSYDPHPQYPVPPRKFVRAVAAGFGIPTTEEHLKATTSAVMSTLKRPSGASHLSAEVRELASRMKIAEPEGWPEEAAATTASAETPPENSEVRLNFVQHLIDGTMPVNTQVTRSIRVRNEGFAPVSSDTPTPVLLSYHWVDEKGNVIIYEGSRSPLPDRLERGNEISVIMRIQTPPHPGKHRLQIRVIQEFVKWHEDTGLDIEIEITDRINHCLIGVDRNNEPFRYERTQEEAIALVKRHFPIGPGGRRKRILEIGGGVYPVAISRSQDTADVVSVDISFAMSQLGSIVHSLPGRGGDPAHFLFIAADAMRLPFAPKTFDGIVLCRVLHHFPDPIGLLRQLTKLLGREGRFIVACEPCNPDPFEPQYLRDLRSGINEQQWTLEEYAHVFTQSGLEPIEATVLSNCALMTALKPSRIDGVGR